MKSGCRRTRTGAGAAILLILMFLQFHLAPPPRAYANTPPTKPSSSPFMCGGVKRDGAHPQASPYALPQWGGGSISIAFDGSFPVANRTYTQTLFNIVYPAIVRIYGYPSNAITITVRYNSTAGGWSYYVPRTNSIELGLLPIVNPPNTNNASWDGAFTHELIHGFHDAFWEAWDGLSASWNEEGMTEAATEIVALNIQGTRNIVSYSPVDNLRLYDEFSYLGKDVVGGTTYAGGKIIPDIFYRLAASMFWILTTELSTDPTNPYDFLKRLNTRLYTIGASTIIDDATFKDAVKFVAGTTLVEGISPDIWISNQPISYVQGSAGPQLGVYSWEPENLYNLRAFVFNRVVNQTNPWNTRENPISGVSVTIQVFDWAGSQVANFIGPTDSSGTTNWFNLGSSYPLPFGAYRIVATATGGGLSSPLTSVTYARGTGNTWWIIGADTSVYGVVIDSSGRPVLIPVFVTRGTGTLLILQNGCFAVQPSSTGTRSEFTLTDGLLITRIVAKPNPYTRVVWFSTGFDFYLSASPQYYLPQGGSSNITITVALTGGVTQPVYLSVSGLPSGASASLTPASGNPTFTSTCTISTSSSTPTGSYAITVTGTAVPPPPAVGLTRTTTFTLTVNAVTTIWITTATTTSSTSTSYVSATVSSTQRLNVTSTATSLSTSFLTTATTLISGSVSTTYTSRTTFYVTSTIPSTTVLTSTVRSNSTSTALSKTGTTSVTQFLTSSRTVGNTVYLNVTAQITYIEQYLQRIASTLVNWFNQITQIIRNVFVTATVRDTVVRVEPGLGSTVTGMFSGSDPVGFMMTGNIYDDSGLGFIYAHRSPPRILFPKTDTGKVSLTGQPTWSGYSHLVTVGGHAANPTTKYYEDNGLAPIRAVVNSNGTISILRGSALQLNVPLSSISQSNDYFVMQVLSDGAHKIVILWGIAHWGTYASGVYFDGMWFGDMASLTAGWYIIRWQDLNGNGIPDYPGEFTTVSSGT